MTWKNTLLAGLSIAILLVVFWLATLLQQLAGGQLFHTENVDNEVAAPRATETISSGEMACVAEKHRYIIRGDSLAGIFSPGDEVVGLMGYYDCNSMQRGDIVLYDWSGRENPLIKIALAIPGDSFRLVPVGEIWHISVNGTVLKTTNDEPYQVSRSNYRRLSLYERDYGDALPEDTYMLLGNLPTETVDSRVFGLVHKDDIFGKVILE